MIVDSIKELTAEEEEEISIELVRV